MSHSCTVSRSNLGILGHIFSADESGGDRIWLGTAVILETFKKKKVVNINTLKNYTADSPILVVRS